jgi:hypothetical protein
VVIVEELKSLPSGLLQYRPEGSQISVRDAATVMISHSDNTAADLLMLLIGQDVILSSMRGYNSFLDLNSPMMTTMDWFRLRTLSHTEAAAYAALPPEGKISFLSDLKSKISRLALQQDLSSWQAPRSIDKIEWFASTQNICEVMATLKKYGEKDRTILDILATPSPYFKMYRKDYGFEFLGYKGGNESGVLTASFLFKTRKQEWACLSMGINNTDSEISNGKASRLFRGILKFSEHLLSL